MNHSLGVNPWLVLWQSRKMRILLADTFFSILALVLTWFLSPDNLDKALALLAILQPAVMAVIGGIAYEDGQAKQAGLHPAQQPEAGAMVGEEPGKNSQYGLWTYPNEGELKS